MGDDMEKLVIASDNVGKIKEISKILSGKYEVVSMSDAGFKGEIEETGDTFYENALIKARTVSQALGLTALADDSGLCVEALGGAPSIYSARYSGVHGDDAANRALLLKNLEGKTNRRAEFRCAVVLYRPDGSVVSGVGATKGCITEKERGENGFGYDCIFFSYDLNKPFGEATDDEKNSVSHRYRALCNLLEKL